MGVKNDIFQSYSPLHIPFVSCVNLSQERLAQAGMVSLQPGVELITSLNAQKC